jgi:hypothetical protein
MSYPGQRKRGIKLALLGKAEVEYRFRDATLRWNTLEFGCLKCLFSDFNHKICHFLYLFPVIFVTVPIYIAFTTNSAIDEALRVLNEKWGESQQRSAVVRIQWENRCCGWENVSGRSILACPHSFDFGCRRIVEENMRRRCKEAFVSSILELALFVFSLGTIAFLVGRLIARTGVK